MRVAPEVELHAPKALPGSLVEHWVANLSHIAMYGFMLGMPATGIAMGYYGGKGVPFWRQFVDPSDDPEIVRYCRETIASFLASEEPQRTVDNLPHTHRNTHEHEQWRGEGGRAGSARRAEPRRFREFRCNRRRPSRTRWTGPPRGA